ncbi:MAG: ATP synthase F1 subunit gamma [Planctomycetota bacterium]|nr:ATP synthase F1 subunit gamma [Planctomycetota bacterium]
MAKPRAILKRRSSIQNIAKITKTMQMIATAKFKRANDRAVGARPYTDQLTALINELSSAAGEFQHPLLEAREPKRVAVLAIASNRGLCGGYNTNIVKKTAQVRQGILDRGLDLTLEVSGKKPAAVLRFQKVPIDKTYLHFEDKPTFEEVNEVATDFMNRYEAGEIDELHVVYTKFLTAARQEAVVEKVLPLEPPEGKEGRDYLYHPDAASILRDLLPRSVRLHVFQAFLDAAVSEQTARMVAMKAATDNAVEMIKDLTMLYNRSRQTLITTELSEIIGGAAALE